MNEKPFHLRIRESARRFLKGKIRGRVLTSEFYQTEMPDHIASFVQAAIDTAFLGYFLWVFFKPSYLLLSFFLLLLLFWKVARSAYAGWDKLLRLHRTIQEEKYEIEHHRPKERKELEKLYTAKGFSGKLLEELVDTMMADDNRLLQIMLEEEMGLALSSYEHPLKQAAFSALGVLLSSCLIFFGIYLSIPSLFAFLILAISTFIATRYQKTPLLPFLIWNLAIFVLLIFVGHFLHRLQ